MEIKHIKMIADGNWIGLYEATYENHKGNTCSWEFASRLSCNGVVTIIPTTADGSVIVINQFRVPTNTTCWEFPAGLIEYGESPEEAAMRELKEEVGLTGTLLSVSPLLYNSPGMSDEAGYLVRMVVDVDKQEETDFDESEYIITKCIPAVNLLGFLNECIKQGEAVDGKLYMWAMANLN